MPFSLPPRAWWRNPYRSYNAVQATSITLALVTIWEWPNLNIWPFWTALGAYLITFVTSVVIYARHMAISPVRTSYLVGTTALLLVLNSLASLDNALDMLAIMPVILIMLTSGMLYTLALGGLRLRRESRGYYATHKP